MGLTLWMSDNAFQSVCGGIVELKCTGWKNEGRDSLREDKNETKIEQARNRTTKLACSILFLRNIILRK